MSMDHQSLAALALLLLAAPTPAEAKRAKAAVPPPAPAGVDYDGKWVIDATTSSFLCPVKSKQLVATVQGGKVVGLTGLPASVSGSVDRAGAVTINLRLYGVTAQVQGRIDGASGAGAWSADSMICGQGNWSATAAR